jgi:hypothetical protein
LGRNRGSLVTNNRSCRKEHFDWSIYHKPKRILTDDQELTLTNGTMRPLLDYVLSQPDVRFDIRHHKANLYFRGGNLLRIAFEKSPSGGIHHFGEFDLNYSVRDSSLRRANNIVRVSLDTEDEVKNCAAELERFRGHMLGWWADHPKGERTYEQYIAAANEHLDRQAPPEYLVVDIEYQYARRRFDLVALRRNPTEADPVGFLKPHLSLWELKCDKRALSGTSGLIDHADDYSRFVRAENGEHANRAKTEYAAMVKQKQRLRLLPQFDLEEFSAKRPEFLLLFADYEVREPGLTQPLASFLGCLEKDGLLDSAGFADIPRTGERFEEDLTVGPPMSTKAFLDYRCS